MTFDTSIMKLTGHCLIAICAASLLSGCDTMYGVSRRAESIALPQIKQLANHIERYPEISKVKSWNTKGATYLDITGTHPGDEVNYIRYTGGEHIRGIIHFYTDYKGNTTYDNSLMMINTKPPQEDINATVPIMKKIERDLEKKFGITNFSNRIKASYRGVKNPDNL